MARSSVGYPTFFGGLANTLYNSAVLFLLEKELAMTPEERIEMNRLCLLIQNEKDPRLFDRYVRELNELLDKKSVRIHPSAEPNPAARRRIELWLQMPESERIAENVLSFYGRLVTEHPELIPAGPGDPYENLRAELASYIRRG